MCEQVTIGFGFISDWMKKWREFFKPIAYRGNAKAITFQNSSDNHSKVLFGINTEKAMKCQQKSLRKSNSGTSSAFITVMSPRISLLQSPVFFSFI